MTRLSPLLLLWLLIGCPAADDDDSAAPNDDDDSAEEGLCSLPDLELPGPELLPRCDAVTADCIVGCDEGDFACLDACVASDPTPAETATGLDCAWCLLIDWLVCAEPACPDQVEAYRCCEATCGADLDCIDQQCGAWLDASWTCVADLKPVCIDDYVGATGACFPGDER